MISSSPREADHPGQNDPHSPLSVETMSSPIALLAGAMQDSAAAAVSTHWACYASRSTAIG